MTKDAKQLLGKRCLARVNSGVGTLLHANEYKVTECSTSGEYLKLKSMVGSEWWIKAVDLHVIEVLP